ncbi:MAG: hypothetical protein U1A77_15670 [Pirellulales bacterium]
MRCHGYAQLLVMCTLTTFAAELFAQNPTPAAIARQRFNQVSVKVIMPVTETTPKQEGPAIESWVSEQLKALGEPECFAVTDWVTICDGLLSDDDVTNHVWNGHLVGEAAGRFCPVCGDLPERKDGRVSVLATGFDPGGVHAARITLVDEPGTRAVTPVLPYSAGGKRQANSGGKPLAYIAVLIGPPPRKRVASHGAESTTSRSATQDR